MDYSVIRILKIFVLSILSALVPFIILSYMWDGYQNISLRVIIVILAVNTIPCILINYLYYKYNDIKEWISSFYFFISFLLSFLIIFIYGIVRLNGNYFDHLIGFIVLFMLAESMAIFTYISYIFIKYINVHYNVSLLEKIVLFISGIFFTYFIILYTSFSSALIMYIFD